MTRGRYNPYVEQERQRAAEARRVAAEIRAREAEERRSARLRQQAHLRDRTEEADESNQELADQLRALDSLLVAGVAQAGPLDFASLKVTPVFPEFDAQSQDQPAPEPLWGSYEPKPVGFFARLMPGTEEKHQARVGAARQAFGTKQAEWADYEQKRIAWLGQARAHYEAECSRIQAQANAQHAEIDDFETSYRAGEPDAVQQYFSIVVDRDQLPVGFPHTVRVAYVKESTQLVIERELPMVDIVPNITSYHYVRSNDAITA